MRKTYRIGRQSLAAKPGDILTLREWDGEKYTGHKITREVTYVLRNCPEYGLMDGYCIIGIQPIGWNDAYYVPSVMPHDQSQIIRRPTNADDFRAMSDEELATRFAEQGFGICPPQDKSCLETPPGCYACWLDWLQSPADGGDGDD